MNEEDFMMNIAERIREVMRDVKGLWKEKHMDEYAMKEINALLGRIGYDITLFYERIGDSNGRKEL